MGRALIIQIYKLYDIILMLNCNRPNRQSLQRAKRSQKNIHTASIILKPQDSYSDAFYLPLREAVNKRLDNQNPTHALNKSFKKNIDRSFKLDKSPSLKLEKQNKNDLYIAKPEYKLKVLNQSQNRVETDRKSLRKSMDKAMKTIRLKTDYHQLLESRQKEASASKPCHNHNQVSTKNTQEYSNKIVYISKQELGKIHTQLKQMKDQNIALKRQIAFVSKISAKGAGNSVLKALNILN